MSRFSILMYHMISSAKTAEEARYACPPEQFEQHLGYLKSSNHTPVSLQQIDAHLLLGASLPENAVAITLDDGFEDNYTNAYPLLKKYDMPATIFLTSGLMGATNQWMSKRGFPERKMLNWQQIAEMNRHKISFGAHTVSHPKLSEIDAEASTKEIRQSKQTIEEQLEIPCLHFAYPYGLFTEQTSNIVGDAGFTLACSTRSGFNNRERNPLLLHRIEVYGNDPVWKLKQKMTYGLNDASLFFPLKYYAKRALQKIGL